MTLDRPDIPAATTLNNIGQRIGASLGVAAAAVILQRRLAVVSGGSAAGLSHLTVAQRLHDSPAIAHAFGFVFWIIVGLGLIALIPASQLPKRRRDRSSEAAAAVVEERASGDAFRAPVARTGDQSAESMT
jgi:hypothetical protein